MFDLFVAFIILGAIARITRFITADHMPGFMAFRRLMLRTPYFRGMVTDEDTACDWCWSIFVAAPIVFPLGFAVYDQPWWLVVAEWLTASYAVGWLARLEPEEG